MRDWKKVQEGLLNNIYVISSGKKTHLFKALIIGPSNTIYYNSYFIFDICLPNNYPGAPPKVFYCSASSKLHPNLYEDGTVCLSLLGTWSGDQSERWKPSHSSILQLVVSIQGLILGVKEPYYLEAGYEKLKGTKQGAISSKIFNEMGLILSLKHMLQNYENPPPEFRNVIHQHFKENCHEVILLAQACEAIQNDSENKDQLSFKAIREKYNLHDNPSKGFLQPIVHDLKSKFERVLKESWSLFSESF